jgi:hypothetical protein
VEKMNINKKYEIIQHKTMSSIFFLYDKENKTNIGLFTLRDILFLLQIKNVNLRLEV